MVPEKYTTIEGVFLGVSEGTGGVPHGLAACIGGVSDYKVQV